MRIQIIIDDGTFPENTAYFRWLPSYCWQRMVRRDRALVARDLVIAVADHFEPSIVSGATRRLAEAAVQAHRLEHWCLDYPKLMQQARDSDGRPFRHTYFYPAEQWSSSLLRTLVGHCQSGWGEIETQLHHGQESPDTAENTRRVLSEFRDALARQGCLSRWEGKGPPRFGFVHGNFALANSGRARGVDSEMQVLAETGCYADFSLPSAPNPSQVSKINALYECALPLDQRAPHRRGKDLNYGSPPK